MMLVRVRLFFWAILGGTLLVARGAVFSTSDSLIRFSDCLANKVRSSPQFNLKDHNRVREVANVMIGAMEDKTHGPRGHSILKVLAIAFVTSVADLIILEDSERNIQRKNVYQASLNECSLSTIGYIDTAFVSEAVRVLNALEAEKTSRQDRPRGGSFLAPGFSPGFLPSSAQRPFKVSDSAFSGETTFNSRELPASNFGSSFSSYNNPTLYPSRTRQSDFGAGNARQGSSQFTMNFGHRDTGLQEQGGVFAGLPSLVGNKEFDRPQASPVVGDVTVTQNKESGIFPSPSEVYPEPLVRVPLQEKFMTITDVNKNVSSLSQNPIPIISPTPSFEDKDPLADIPVPDFFSLEDIISSILMNSTSFVNSFSFINNQQQAISKAILITQQSLTGYDSDIVAEALNAVSSAISTTSSSSPESYALAIASALASVLKVHDMPLFMGGASIANSMLSSLDSSQESPEQQPNVEPGDSFPGYGMDSWQQPIPLSQEFQAPPVVPESVAGAIFSESLGDYLRKSLAMTEFFCGNTLLDATKEFMLIKSAMAGYGLQVSSIAASTISSVLADLPPDTLCRGYPSIISGTIAEILYENNLLATADPADLSSKFDYSVSILLKPITSSEKPTTVIAVSPNTGTTFGADKTALPLQSSSNAQPELVPTAAGKTPSVYLSSTANDRNAKDSASTPLQGNTGETSQVYRQYDQRTAYQPSGYQTVPMTTPMTLQISDQDLTTTLSMIEALTSAPGVTTTEKVSTKYPPVNQKEVAEMLYDEMMSVLKALSEPQTGVTLIGVTDTTTDSPGQPTGADSAKPKERNRSQRGRKRKKSTTASPSTTDNSSEHVDTQDGSSSDADASTLSKQSPESSNHPVELYPSFQGPPVSDTSSETSTEPSVTSDDPALAVARAVSMIASSTITYIRFDPNFNLGDLCVRLNELATVVGIAPVQNCADVPMIDYLLNVLSAITKILKGV